MMTDPIADMLTRLRNAAAVRKPEVVLPFSKLKFSIGEILKHEGYVKDVEKVPAKPGSAIFDLRIILKYDKTGVSALQHLKRISKPGRRVYQKYSDLSGHVSFGRGLVILSTPQGLMTASKAKTQKIGGEVLCEIH